MKNILTIGGLLLLMISCGTTENSVADKKSDFDQQITEKYWKLVQLDGEAVEMAEEQRKETYFMLKTDENHLTGFSGCNTFSGKYELKENNEIEFSQVIGTLMACQFLKYKEADFLKVFNGTKSYQIDHDKLSLLAKDGSVLAQFEVVYF